MKGSRKRHAGAEARREAERQAALGVAADPQKATGAEVLRAREVERQAMAEEVARARTLPAAEARKVLPQLEELRDRIVGLDAELATRPALVKSPDGLPVNLNTARPPESKETWFRRALDTLGIAAGVAQSTPTGTVTLSKEDEMQLTLARLRRARGPEPRGLSVAAAVAHWLASAEGWGWLAGTQTEMPALEEGDVFVLTMALGLIARDGEGGSVTVLARSPLRGTRAEASGFLASCDHLARCGLLTIERRLPHVKISYGPRTRSIARQAGIVIEGDRAK